MELFKKGNKKKTEGKKEKAHSKRILEDMRFGRSISIEFIRYNAWLLLVFLIAIISLMGLRYKTKTGMEQIKKLKAELTRAESVKLKEKAEYMSLIRESEMKRLIEEKNMNLYFLEEPAEEVIVTE